MTVSSPETTAAARLRSTLKCAVITPSDAGYDAARRVFIGGPPRWPAAVVRPSGPPDVARVVLVARELGLDLSVRSGGHSIARHGVCDHGIVLDLSGMRGLDIDATSRQAWAQTGLTAGEYTTAAGRHGLATGFGDTGSVGIGGLTLGGGIGYLTRKHGLTIDSVMGAEVVTADGQVIHADAECHPDLFWAIRGGGGNFGVVTRLHLRLHDVGTVLGGMLMLPATPNVMAGFVDEASRAPDELTTLADVMLAPPMPFIPHEVHGQPVIMIRLCYAGDPAQGERVVSRLRRLAAPVADMVEAMPYPQLYQDEESDEPRVCIHSTFLDALSVDDAATILEHVRMSDAPVASAEIRVLGGAVSRVPADATAFAHRGRSMMVTVAAMYDDPEEADRHQSWVNGLAQALGGRGAYVNFLGDQGGSRIREAYPGSTWDRLAAVKAAYDPTNVFRVNHNVMPLLPAEVGVDPLRHTGFTAGSKEGD